MTKFEVGDKVVPDDRYTAKTTYTIVALQDERDNGDWPAWVTSVDNPVFGTVINLKFMELYFEPGFFQWRGWDGKNMQGEVKWYNDATTIKAGNYVRVNVVPTDLEEEINDEDV